MIAAGANSIAAALSSGQIVLLDVNNLNLAGIIDAHRGVAWDVDYSNERGLVSVGADMKLRTWQLDPTLRSVGDDSGVIGRYAQARFRDSFRHQLQATNNPRRVNMTHIDSNMGFVIDRATLEIISEGRISINWDMTMPTGTEGLFMSVLQDRKEAVVVDIVRSETAAIPLESQPMPARMTVAVNAEANAVAIATSTYLQAWTEPTGWMRDRFDEERDLILLEIDEYGGATGLDSRGIGDSPSGPWALTLAEDQRLAAIVREGPARFIAADSSGTLLRFNSADGEVIGSVGADADVFDLHVSANGNLVAAIGSATTRFFSIRDERVIAEMSGQKGAPVVDLLFDEQGSSGIYLRSNGVVGRFDVPGISQRWEWRSKRHARDHFLRRRCRCFLWFPMADVAISYSTKDRAQALEIVQTLRGWRTQCVDRQRS